MSLTWHQATPTVRVTPASASQDDVLAGWNAVVTANSADAAAYWEVAEYQSTSPRYLLLKRKNGAAGRIIIFGQNGSTPNAAAVRGTATASVHYIAYSASSTANTPDASYLSGAPLSASDYIPGVCVGTISNTKNKMFQTYCEHQDGIFFAMVRPGATDYAVFSAGDLIVGVDGSTTYPTIQGSGTGAGTGSWAQWPFASGSMFPGTPAADNSYSTFDAGIVARFSGSNRLIYRIFAFANDATTFGMQSHLIDTSSMNAHFFPIWLCFNTTNSDAVLGKFRQVAFGPGFAYSFQGYRKEVGGGSPNSDIAAYYVCAQATTVTTQSTPVWFTNFEV